MRHDEKPLKRITNGRTRWVARATGPDGKRKSYGTFDREGPCRRPLDDGMCCARHRILWSYQQGVERPATVGTVGAYADVWLDRHPRSERSNRALSGRVKAALDADLGDGPLHGMLFADVDRTHAVRLREVLLVDHGRALRGAKGIIGAVNTMWLDALDDGWTKTQSPFLNLRIKAKDPRIAKAPRTPVVLSWERMHAICAAGGQHEPMLRVLSDCGLRIGEMLALQRRDVKLGATCDEDGCASLGPHLHVRRNAWDGRVFDGTKTAERTAPLTSVLAALLGRVTPIAADGLMFPRPSGGAWWDANWRRDVWFPALDGAGEPRTVTPHHFRHSWVSNLRAAGLDIADVAESAGHSVETATRVYTHALNRSHEAMRRAVGQ